jgi:Xaa-Pro aminopeptidase
MQLQTASEIQLDLERRLTRVRGEMAAAGIGTLVIYYGGQHNASRFDPVFYLTDYRTIGASVAVVPLHGTPQLLLGAPWDDERARASAAHMTVLPSTPQTLIADAVRAARELPAPLALSGRAIMPISVYDELQAGLGATPGDGEAIVPAVAATRTPVELARVERAAEIADEGFQALCAAARVGMREYELAAEVDAALRVAGAEDNFGLIAAGASNVAIRPPTDRKLERGDVIIGEITPCYHGYLSQLCRTYILGAPTPDQRRIFDLLVEAELAGLRVAVPGGSSAQIAVEINRVIAAAGYAEYCVPPYMRSRGHGLGTGGVVPADVNEHSPRTLERDMTFVVHPNQFVPETGYMMCGDMIVVEDGGARRLTQTPLRLYAAEA